MGLSVEIHRGAAWALLGAALLPACSPAAPPMASPSPPAVTDTPSPLASPSPLELPPCEYPKKERFPEWVPKDLPLPKGTYAMQRLKPLAGYKRALLVVRVTLEKLTTHVLTVWPEKGWVLGQGDAEPGEIEDQFSRPPSIGAFKAQAVFCDPGFVIMYLIYAKRQPKVPGPALTPSPQGSPLVPSPSPTG